VVVVYDLKQVGALYKRVCVINLKLYPQKSLKIKEVT